MFRLIYVSSAVNHLSKDALVALLRKSRDNNSQLDITGILLYKDGDFLQVLEGEETTVRKLLEKIIQDKQHNSAIVLCEEKIDARLFGTWSMAFHDLADPAIQSMPGFSPFMNRSLKTDSFQNDPDGVMDMIKFFAESR